MTEYNEQSPMRTLHLDGTNTVEVPAVYYPWLMEWSWRVDRASQMVYRLENGKRIYLYHEMVKRMRPDEDGMVVALDDEPAFHLFAKHPEFDTLVGEWIERVEVLEGQGFFLPDPVDMLSVSLSVALSLYFKWVRDGVSYEHIPDLTGQTPGLFVTHRRTAPRPGDASPPYTTLGAWMHAEWTGLFEDPEGYDPTDVGPMMFLDAICNAVMWTVEDLTEDINDDTDPETIFRHLDAAGLPVDAIVERIVRVIQDYELPT
jgi:hypothetical protein